MIFCQKKFWNDDIPEGTEEFVKFNVQLLFGWERDNISNKLIFYFLILYIPSEKNMNYFSDIFLRK